MSREYPCVHHKNGWCYFDPEQPDACVFGPCDNETPSHGDKIRRMSDEELASVLVRYEGTEKRTTVYGGHEHIFHGPNGDKCGTREYAVQLWTDWLRKPAKED